MAELPTKAQLNYQNEHHIALDAFAALLHSGRLDKNGVLHDQPRNGHKNGAVNGDARPFTTPRLVNLATVTPKPVTWLWPRRIAIGKLTTIAGEPGLGKSQLTLDLAARVSTGNPWPDGTLACGGSVILLSAEDDIEDTIVPRLIAAGADRTKITAMQGVDFKIDDDTPAKERCFNLEQDLPALEQALDAQPDCRLVIIDPISSYLGNTDSHKNAELRGLLAPLGELATKRGVAVLTVTHLNKTSGAKAMHRITGSLAFVAASRAAWLVTPDRENAKRRLLLPIKNNLAADNGGLAFGIVGIDVNGDDHPALAWEIGRVEITADEALSEDTLKRQQGRTQAKAWLKSQLADGPRTQEYLKSVADDADHKWRTVERAADELGIQKFKSGFRGGWSWRLPSEDDQEAPSPTELASFDENEF